MPWCPMNLSSNPTAAGITIEGNKSKEPRAQGQVPLLLPQIGTKIIESDINCHSQATFNLNALAEVQAEDEFADTTKLVCSGIFLCDAKYFFLPIDLL